jgi:hypothetical protein
MKQLEIQYFFPLTEQIPLDLDYTRTNEYEEEKRRKLLSTSLTSVTLSSVGNFTALSLTTNKIDWDNSTRLGNWEIENSKRKPGLLEKFFMKKIFGMKWMGK